MNAPDHFRVMPAVISPKTRGEDALDIVSFRQHLAYLYSNKIREIFLFGTNGEGLKVPQNEMLRGIEVASEFKGSNDGIKLSLCLAAITEVAVKELLEKAKEAGNIDSVVWAPQYIPETSAAETFERVFDNTDIPVMGYDIPGEGKSLPRKGIERLLSFDQLTGWKNSSPEEGRQQWLYEETQGREGFTLWYGSESQMIADAGRYGDGIVSGTANVIPCDFSALRGGVGADSLKRVRKSKENVDAAQVATGKKGVAYFKQLLATRGFIKSKKLF